MIFKIMKELSIEQKAQRYDEALKYAKSALDCLADDYICNHLTKDDIRGMYARLFPEFNESEDERIRKALRERIIRYDPNNEILIKEEGISQKQFLAWIEKQGEGHTEALKEAVDAEIVEVEDDNCSMCAYTHLEICTDEDLSKICKAGDKAKVIIIKQEEDL